MSFKFRENWETFCRGDKAGERYFIFQKISEIPGRKACCLQDWNGYISWTVGLVSFNTKILTGLASFKVASFIQERNGMIKQRTCLLVRETKRIFEEAGIKWHYINQWLPKSGLHDNWHFPSKIHKDSTSLQIKNRIFIEGFMGAKGFINRRRMENKYRTEMLKGE